MGSALGGWGLALGADDAQAKKKKKKKKKRPPTPPATCRGIDQSCNSNADCCSLECSQALKLCTCTGSGGACEADENCCAYYTREDACISNVCCRVPGKQCQDGYTTCCEGECCGGRCCATRLGKECCQGQCLDQCPDGQTRNANCQCRACVPDLYTPDYDPATHQCSSDQDCCPDAGICHRRGTVAGEQVCCGGSSGSKWCGGPGTGGDYICCKPDEYCLGHFCCETPDGNNGWCRCYGEGCV